MIVNTDLQLLRCNQPPSSWWYLDCMTNWQLKKSAMHHWCKKPQWIVMMELDCTANIAPSVPMQHEAIELFCMMISDSCIQRVLYTHLRRWLLSVKCTSMECIDGNIEEIVLFWSLRSCMSYLLLQFSLPSTCFAIFLLICTGGIVQDWSWDCRRTFRTDWWQVMPQSLTLTELT